MAPRYTAAEVLDLLDEFGLSDSESNEEGDGGVSAYRDNSSVDLEEVAVLGDAVTSERLASSSREAALTDVASAFLDSSADEGMEEDFQGENKH